MYIAFKFMHVLGVVLLLGNVTASAIWKVFANRDRHPAVVAFAQKLVTYTDWSLTLIGVVLIITGGYGMVHLADMDLSLPWLLWSQLLFALSGAIWIFRLIPIQMAQSRLAAQFSQRGDAISAEYWLLCRRWIVWGSVATVPLVIATYLMVAKT